jgi:hypothetical protein
MDPENEVDEGVGIVHPAQVQDDRRMECAQAVQPSLGNGRDKDGEGGDENGDRDVVRGLELLLVDFPIVHESIERRYEAEEVLHVGRAADADASDVWVGWDQARHSAQQVNMCMRKQARRVGYLADSTIRVLRQRVLAVSTRQDLPLFDTQCSVPGIILTWNLINACSVTDTCYMLPGERLRLLHRCHPHAKTNTKNKRASVVDDLRVPQALIT